MTARNLGNSDHNNRRSRQNMPLASFVILSTLMGTTAIPLKAQTVSDLAPSQTEQASNNNLTNNETAPAVDATTSAQSTVSDAATTVSNPATDATEAVKKAEAKLSKAAKKALKDQKKNSKTVITEATGNSAASTANNAASDAEKAVSKTNTDAPAGDASGAANPETPAATTTDANNAAATADTGGAESKTPADAPAANTAAAQSTQQDSAAQAAAEAEPETPEPAATPVVAKPFEGTIKSLAVVGTERLEPDTVLSYTKLKAGLRYNSEVLDTAIQDLYATQLFSDVVIEDNPNNPGSLTLQIHENPIINRIVLEGNKRLKEDKIRPEIKLSPRQIFTRDAVRADVSRIIELYRRQGRFAATVEPKMVRLEQNRVDIVFEITEGPKSKVRQINVIGNKQFSDAQLRKVMATKQSRLWRFMSSGASYDPDKLAYDQQKLRQFYLVNGYADFRVVSAIAELTPDRRDFIITYVVEEGDRYKFGDVSLDSQIRDVKADNFKSLVKIKKGQWYNAKQVEDTIDTLTEAAGLMGYTPDVNPNFTPDKDNLTMGIEFRIAEAPRQYIERVDISGNTTTRDKVIRREFRLAEGDVFNLLRVKRSRDRVQSLGFFQDKLEITQRPGSTPDRLILDTNLQEKSTGQLSVSAGYSSLERILLDISIQQNNFMGKGQSVRASANWSYYSKSVDLGFTEPYLFDHAIAFGGDIFRNDYNAFNYMNGTDRNTTYRQASTGLQLRAGIPITEYLNLLLRYSISYETVKISKSSYYTNGQCDPLLAGRYLCEALGSWVNSTLGYSIAYNSLNNIMHPTSGARFTFSQDFAGLGGTVHYLKTRIEAAKYWNLTRGFVFSLRGEAGYIWGYDGNVRLIDRFFLGQPQFRGFNFRGVGPRVTRHYYSFDDSGNASLGGESSDDSLGGTKEYLGHAELEIPMGAGAREMGLRPSIFADIGSVWGVPKPALIDSCGSSGKAQGQCAVTARQVTNSKGQALYTDSSGNYTTSATGNTPVTTSVSPIKEYFLGDTWKPRISVGFGVNWNSPFGPFRIDIAKAIVSQPGDDKKLVTFNVGTAF
ncbi:MAG: outer membrane protein assembly factor BamA [Zymomonas mobilis]|uniref:Outer membrane protein assembly factor BamA n=1 Tax=Zymomonas mobilis TaxID=542 RepID=A0A542W1S4_ZYMMB|nr:outer membrane protein assembly factor BamA [Zymomonas mobilis]TQL17526.1 Beta-barrel assembly machine subunit BamA [Zymomonas mobilis]